MLQNMLMNLFHVLVFPGLLFVVVVGLFLAGLDRKLVARMQKRVGPPLIQPWYDFLKCLGKETIVPANANRAAYLGAPIVSFTSLIVTMLFIPVFQYGVFGGSADIVVILYLLTIPAAAIIVGGSASGSQYAGVGISREMVTMIGYELPLVLSLLAVARKVGGTALCFSLTDIINWQQTEGCLAFSWALIPAAIAFLLVIPSEVGTQPFDVAEAETEICEGTIAEYSGSPLAMFKLSSYIRMFTMTALFTDLFFGGINTGYVALDAVVFVAICAVVTFLTMSIPHAIAARFKVERLFKYNWTLVAGLAFVSFVLVWFGL